MKRYVVSALLVLAVSSTGSGQTKDSPVPATLEAELSRLFDHFKSQPAPTYFLSYEVTETNDVNVFGSFGTLMASGEDRQQLDIDLRVGCDFSLDDTRQVSGGLPVFNDRYSPVTMAVEDDLDALRAIVSYQTARKRPTFITYRMPPAAAIRLMEPRT